MKLMAFALALAFFLCTLPYGMRCVMFLLFAWNAPFANGGFSDLVGKYKSLDSCLAQAEKFFFSEDWGYQIVDVKAGFKIVSESSETTIELDGFEVH